MAANARILGCPFLSNGSSGRPNPTQRSRTNQNDFADAEAIAEALIRPTMRFVSIKTDEQLDMQSLHRVLERWIVRRTAVVNHIPCLLLERGVAWRWLTSWHVLHGLCLSEARSTALLF
jgi:transposase